MKKIGLLVSGSMLVVLIIIAIIYFLSISTEKNFLKYYHKVVLTKKDTKLVDRNQKEIGFLEKGITILLEEPTSNLKNTYFKIQDTDFYIYYKDVEEAENTVSTLEETPWNENIITNSPLILYTEDNRKIELSTSLSLPIYEKEENTYKIWYLNQWLQIEKNQKMEIKKIESENLNTDKISVLYYKTIEEHCSTTNCISKKDLKKQMNLLQEQGYQSITLKQYEKWLQEKIPIVEKSILLLSDNRIENDTFHFEDINETTLTFLNNNKVTTLKEKKTNMYTMTTSLSPNQFEKMINGEPIEIEITSSIPVVNYHFFYDSRLQEGCNEAICLDMSKFEQQIEYLLENDYKTLTIEEFAAWKYGEIELPKKSILLTIDDGALGTGIHNGNKLIPTLEKYDINATLFLISGWWGKENYISQNLNIESHTHDMHNEGFCKNQTRGARMLCSTKQQVLDDLKKSISTLNTNTAFCFPFYASNTTTINAVKESGFKIAFIGGNKHATREQNHYQITRYPIYNSTTIEQFKKMIKA